MLLLVIVTVASILLAVAGTLDFLENLDMLDIPDSAGSAVSEYHVDAAVVPHPVPIVLPGSLGSLAFVSVSRRNNHSSLEQAVYSEASLTEIFA